MQLTIDRAVLEILLEQAESVSYLVGGIAERAADRMVEQRSDDIDAIVHELNELLGNPHLIAASVPNARSTFASHELGPVLDPAGLVIGFTDDESMRPHMGRLRSRFLLGSSPPRVLPLAIEREVSCEPDPIAGVIVFADESTQPHKVRADDRQARGHRAMSSEVAGASLWWRRGATLAGLIVLVELMFRGLGSCGGAR